MGATAETPVTEFMTKNPVALALDDDCTLATAAFREYRLKSLPIVESKDNRKLVGCLRLRRLLAYLLNESRIGQDGAADPGIANSLRNDASERAGTATEAVR